jgi:sugar phosphate isomerase/epimerase
MNRDGTTRRRFLGLSASAVAAAGWLTARRSRSESASKLKPIRLGGPVFGAPADPEGLALAHKKLGYRAAYCPNVKLDEKEKIRDIIAAFRKHDVIIAEVGRWCNLLDADPAKRAANRKTVTDGLALAEEIGARCCVDIAGSYNRQAWDGPHDDNLSQRFLEETVDNARAIIDAVKPKRAKFCFEMMPWAIPDSADSCLKLIKAVQRDAFAVHLDPCNIINTPEKFRRTTDVLNECFDKLAPWIVSCHAKDIEREAEMVGRFHEVPLSAGKLDYPTYLKRLAALPADVPLMLEHMKPAEYDTSRQYLYDLGRQIGVSFG